MQILFNSTVVNITQIVSGFNGPRLLLHIYVTIGTLLCILVDFELGSVTTSGSILLVGFRIAFK